MDAEILRSLHLLAGQIKAGDQAGQLSTLERVGLARLFEFKTVVLALCVGDVALVTFIAALGSEYSPESGRFLEILRACQTAQENRMAAESGDGPGDCALVQEIIRCFGEAVTAESILSTIKDELVISNGPPAEVIEASVAEMKRKNWATAAKGFMRAHAQLQQQTPKPVYAQAATCLHHLGRYAEAEKMCLLGLGAQRELIAIKAAPPSEESILRHWSQPRPPLVSIACTAYNHERYIESTIRGFLSQQTSFPFEILIHDDASTDGTAAVIRAWHEKYPSIIRPILQTENQFSKGVRPFELLLRQARGRYVATCEGDDYWIEPAKLQKQVGFLEAHPDFSCAGHSYYLYNESRLSLHLWDHSAHERIISERQLMNVSRLFWLPTLVFRKTFSTLPEERDFAPIGDQFLNSYLGTFGKGIYFESFLGSVRRENQHSMWTPLGAAKKDRIRVKTWLALVRMHERMGNDQAAADLLQRVAASPLDGRQKEELIIQSLELRQPQLQPALNE